jgi:DNA-binding SARP family transcriptional activator/transcriptional regulator with XRE-family HTH domain
MRQECVTGMDKGGNEHARALIREHRRVAGLTQRQLAKTAGVSIGVVRDLEQGRTAGLQARSAAAVVRALGLDTRQSGEFDRVTRSRPRSGPPAAARPGPGSASGLRLSVLGPLTGWRGGVLADLGPPSQRAVLALLALSPGEVLHRETIIDSLWGDRPPVTAVGQVQRYASRLRRILDPGRPPRDPRGLLVSTGTGYRLQVTAAQLDLLAFRDLAGQGTAARAAGDGAAACDLFERALGLWRGDPLTDVEPLRQHPAVIGLGRQRAAVTVAHAETAFGACWYERALPHLQDLARREPLNERAHALLIVALAGSGQQAEALAVFEDLRWRLGEQLGVLPCAEVAEARERVLRGQVPRPADCGELRPRLAARPVPRQLPSATPHFAGRAAELSALTTMLRQAPAPGAALVSVIGGTPGVGKTALALHWARQVAGGFPDGQLYVNLSGFGPSGPPVAPAVAVRGFLDSLGVAPSGIPADLGARVALYRSLVAGQRMLIMLDNARDAAQVRPLLPGGADALVLVTSRTQLTGLAASDGACLLPLDLVSETEARELLARRLGPVQVAAEPGPVTELIGLCARLPLALSIVAGRAATRPGLTLAALAAELRDRETRLDGLGTGDAATDVRTVFSWSCRPLSGPGARTLTVIGMHPGLDITVRAAVRWTGLSPREARRALTELVRAHLITEHAVGRYSCHELLRVYAAELADGRGQRAHGGFRCRPLARVTPSRPRCG